MTDAGVHELPANSALPRPPNINSDGPERATMARLDGQIEWYDRRATRTRRLYKSLKSIILASAAAIPVLTTSGLPHGTHLAAALGVMIAVLEGIQQLNQFQANWTNYRNTAEALKHEKFFYLARAGAYSNVEQPGGLLADRVESLIAQENSKWFMSQAQTALNDPSRLR